MTESEVVWTAREVGPTAYMYLKLVWLDEKHERLKLETDSQIQVSDEMELIHARLNLLKSVVFSLHLTLLKFYSTIMKHAK